MIKLIYFIISPLLLLISILFSNFSGNDKAPVFILFSLGIITLIFIISGIISLIKNKEIPNSKFLSLGALLTIVYFLSVVFLSKAGVIDSHAFLGIR